MDLSRVTPLLCTFMLVLAGAAVPPQKTHLLHQAARTKGFPFSSSRITFLQELVPAFADTWAANNVLLGRSAAQQGRHLIDCLNCTSWEVSRVGRTGRALEVLATLGAAAQDRQLSPPTVLRFRVHRENPSGEEERILQFSVCAGSTKRNCPNADDWRPLIQFEGTPREGSGFKKVKTEGDNLVAICRSHAPALSSIDLAELLASIPLLPAAWVNCVRAHVLEEVCAEAAWEESSGTLLDSSEYSTSERYGLDPGMGRTAEEGFCGVKGF